VLDHWRPLTALLAATCLWALVLLVLAFTGLGGRVPPLADNPALARPVPQARLEAVATRLGPATDYTEVGERPLLVPDRRPKAAAASGEASSDLDVALTSVLITPRLQMAILTDNQGGASRRVKVGDVVPGTSWRLVSVEPRRAVVEGPSGQRVLMLRTYTGGGTPPGGTPPGAAATTMNPETVPPPAPVPAPEGGPAVAEAPAPPGAVPPAAPTDTLTQEQQIEAIRRRIEARRAQMRAEAAKAAGDKR
jgi:general secretion pathway protein N